MDAKKLSATINRTWDESIVERLVDYVRIPNKSPMFDPQWERNGHMEAAVTLHGGVVPRAGAARGRASRCAACRAARRCCWWTCRASCRAACCSTVTSTSSRSSPAGCRGLGPWEPVLRDGKLYGRGGADDGYAVFSSLTAIAALKAQQVRLPRCVVLIEACEESGSVDLPAHLDRARRRASASPRWSCASTPSAATTSSCGARPRCAATWSATLRVRVLTEGVHSGMATGIAADAVSRFAQQLLARIENAVTGDMLLEELHVDMPADRRAQTAARRRRARRRSGRQAAVGAGRAAVSNDPTSSCIINSTWRAHARR